MAEERISIAELLAHVSDELRDLQKAAAASGHQPFMRFQECELELAVEAEKVKGAGLKVYLLKLGGSRKKANSHTIRVKMTALTEAPGEYDLAAYSESVEKTRRAIRHKRGKRRSEKGRRCVDVFRSPPYVAIAFRPHRSRGEAAPRVRMVGAARH